MGKAKSFSKIIKEKEKMREYTVNYWKYIFSFCILQLFDMFFIEAGFRWTPFLLIELFVFGAIGLALLGIYLYYFVQCKFRNREVWYDKILKEYYVDESIREYANFGIAWKRVMTLTAHSEMNQQGSNGRVFWGWGDDGILTVAKNSIVSETFETGLSLKVRPWTCTEQKNIKLEVATPKLGERLSEEEFQEMFARCMKQEKIDYSNQLYLYPLFLDAEGRVVQITFPKQAGKPNVVQPYLVTEDMLDAESNIKEKFFETCIAELQAMSGNVDDEPWKVNRYGIVSLFQQVVHCENELPKIGMLAFVQLEDYMIEQLTQADIKLDYIQTEEEIIDLLFDDSVDEVEQYALLIYAYAKKNRYDFVDCFISSFRKLEKNIKAKKHKVPKERQEQIYDGNAKEKLWAKIKLGVRRLLYKLSKFVSTSIWTKILFLLIFALENIIEPFAAGSVRVELTFETVGKALIDENAETFSLLLAIGLVWGILLFIFNRDSVKKWMNPGIEMMNSLTTTKKEQYVQIGENTNLFWADDLIEGWSGDKITISVVRDSYQLTEELRQYENEKILNETNDGTKFRMIHLSEDKERDKIQILVDCCKYTDTMRVQEMLKRYRTNQEGELYYKVLREGLINLKERSTAIRLENIPPNSLCLHAFVMTSDDYVLLTTRGENLSYYPGAYDCSAEEQLHMDDFEQDGVRIQNWVERFLDEELGLTKENCGSSNIGTINLMSVFIEEDALNTALAVKIRLNTSKKELEAILDNWPRKDYEFKYQLVNWETLVQLFELAQSGQTEKKFHPTAINRLYLAACSEMRFDMAKRVYQAFSMNRK